MRQAETRLAGFRRSTLVASALPLVLMLAAQDTRAGDIDGIALTVVKGPGAGQISLSWAGGTSPYAVYRSANPATVTNPGNKLTDTFSFNYVDVPPAGSILYYRVKNSDCPTQPDVPELSFADTNCDGIDGNASAAIFVDAFAGNDANPGTMAQPKRTIGSGIIAAASAGKSVYLSKGNYSESVTLASGVSLYGGYDASASWSRALTNVTTILSPSETGVLGANLTMATEVQLIVITSANAAGTLPTGGGRTSTGVLIRASSATVTLRALDVTAGNGSTGLAGQTGIPGGQGFTGGNAMGSMPGSQGGSVCGGIAGGSGGPGVSGTVAGLPGQEGNSGGGGAGGNGGAGGAAGSCTVTTSTNGGNAPPLLVQGGHGSPGLAGLAGANLGPFDGLGTYNPPPGGTGNPGFPGGGGGGGGSGGGTASATNMTCSNCNSLTSGGGGGGGGGGCGGGEAQGGRGGGASFAVAVVDASVVLEGCTLRTGNGGTGAAGGNGGAGGSGGGGGQGSSGQTRSSFCVTRSAGSGANGASGGNGGTGGPGAGGAGGPAACVAYMGSAPAQSGGTCTLGQGGSGGPGGVGAVVAPSGPNGVTAATLSVP